MPFALDSLPELSEISEAVNYLLANFGANIAADPVTGQITGPTGTVIAYLYKYLAVKYADSADGSLNFSDSPTGRLYYGLRNTDDSVESTNPADYIWTKVAGGFGTTNFLWYITGGGRQIQFFVGPAAPDIGWVQTLPDAIDLDIITSTLATPAFLPYFQPATLQVIRTGNPLTPNFTGVTPKLYATAGGAMSPFVDAQYDTDPAFGNNTWRIGNSSTTGYGDITYYQIAIGTPTNAGGYALWPQPTGMTGTPASLIVPVRYKDSFGVVTQSSPAIIQFVFTDQGSSGDKIAYPSVYQWNTSIPTISGTSTYTWSSNTFSPTPSGWSTAPTSATPGFTLYEAKVTLSAAAGATTSTINWTTASVLSIGYAGGDGLSSRICYARVASNPTPVSGNIVTSGSSGFPTSTQSSTTWGFAATWGASDPNPSSTNSLYQSDGIYNATTNQTTWTTPYISSLKVGQLSAVATNTGTLTVDSSLTMNTTGYIRGGQTAYNTGTGFFLGYSATTYKMSIGVIQNGTADVSTDVITSSSHGLSNNTPVSFTSIGAVTGISVNTTYYVVSSTTNTFKISLTIGGSSIDLTGTSSSVSFTSKNFSWDGSDLSVVGGSINGSTLTGGVIQTGTSGARLVMGGPSYQQALMGYNSGGGLTMGFNASVGQVYASNYVGGIAGDFDNSSSTSPAIRGSNTSSGNGVGIEGRSSNYFGGAFYGGSTSAPVYVNPVGSLPTQGAINGALCVYNNLLYFHNGTTWKQVVLI